MEIIEYQPPITHHPPLTHLLNHHHHHHPPTRQLVRTPTHPLKKQNERSVWLYPYRSRSKAVERRRHAPLCAPSRRSLNGPWGWSHHSQGHRGRTAG
ncbi:hypothetical protein E2C01_054657 [Portunus trituberculatus]|uniref:Uncharacterized protein n=1 Tax=Portunus trituberculatus TaxID=210409 RepID=A0A5B7GVL2_PORTR|nr:hypothetical protein [Portunus trituberculatus]